MTLTMGLLLIWAVSATIGLILAIGKLHDLRERVEEIYRIRQKNGKNI